MYQLGSVFVKMVHMVELVENVSLGNGISPTVNHVNAMVMLIFAIVLLENASIAKTLQLATLVTGILWNTFIFEIPNTKFREQIIYQI